MFTLAGNRCLLQILEWEQPRTIVSRREHRGDRLLQAKVHHTHVHQSEGGLLLGWGGPAGVDAVSHVLQVTRCVHASREAEAAGPAAYGWGGGESSSKLLNQW